MKNRLYRLAALLIMTALLAACSQNTPAATDEAASSPAQTEAPETASSSFEETAEASSSDTSSSDTSAADETTSEAAGELPADWAPDVRFRGTDQYGNEIDESIFQDHVLTMINFWEPWCGPCVGEMPELEQLYQDRAGELQILGVYWTEDGTAEVLSSTGVTYPVILYDEAFARYQSGYVPTTIFVDPGGHVIGSPYVGSRAYADWNEIISKMIGH
mgnify:CR=1 FL=1